MTLHDCGFQRDSWQCKGSHLKPEEKVPPSLREVTNNPSTPAIIVTMPTSAKRRGRPPKADGPQTSAQRVAAHRARKAAEK